ncbi:VWA domain-containing protein [Micromonospora fluostatini]|uniref:VWA domain-containing protein n=2 Tax=Micromonospora TaxID=1873 RepID=A0ABY2DLV5_9ACTN|nr:VWA domain-containing protein [Micromonospora fluostatini]
MVLVAGCTGDEPAPRRSEGTPGGGLTLRIVAGSEQKSVIDTIVTPWCESRGHHCVVTLQGSVDQARLLAAGSREHDVYWFASSVFSQLGDEATVLQDVKPMFLTPVVFAGWRSEMQRLGFAGRSDVGIAEILRAVESDRTRVWITNPTQSNSGATVLFGFMNHFAGNGPGTPLSAAQLDSPAVEQGVSRFVAAMDQTPPSTGTLMTECLARPTDCRTLFTYEDLVIEKNQELVRDGREPLVVAYPRGSLAISDAPLGFLPRGDDGDAGRRAAFRELQEHLLTDAGAQAQLRKLGRRPVGGVGLTLDNPDLSVFNPEWGIQATINEQGIQYPAAPVIRAALDRYQTRYRPPVDTFYCLDGSGSMASNEGWNGVRAAGRQIFDQGQAALTFLQTHPQDTTTVGIFTQDLVAGTPWRVDGDNRNALHGLVGRIDAYQPDGGTDMYACLRRAASDLSRLQAADRRRLVVLMTDGRSTGQNRDAAVAALTAVDVPVIAIAFGRDVDAAQLREVATATGGAYVQQDDLVAALRQAAGYK